MAHGLETIDWHAPWLAHLRERGGPIANKCTDKNTDVCDVLNASVDDTAYAKTAIKFVPQADLPTGTPYESCIFDLKQCPTRNNLHDFFNGLCWLHFPKIKARLNQLHAEQIQQCGSTTQRGKVRDALTLLDENGAFLIAPELLWQALLDKDWHKLFVTLRPLWQEAKLVLFGHALMEKLVTPRKPITAHVYMLDATKYVASQAINMTANANFFQSNIEKLDIDIADDINAEKMAQKPFLPLPVLGVPGWWPANENPDFYTDSQVFRTPTSCSA